MIAVVRSRVQEVPARFFDQLLLLAGGAVAGGKEGLFDSPTYLTFVAHVTMLGDRGTSRHLIADAAGSQPQCSRA